MTTPISEPLSARRTVNASRCRPFADGHQAEAATPPVPAACRRWNSIYATQPARRSVTCIDLDVTEACNLACPYCFKWQKKAVHMDEPTAMAALDWLLEASGDFRGELKVNFMGGEPLLRFDLIQKIVPYGKGRARQLHKQVHFGCTTNCTRLTDEMIEFWRRYGMGFHCSIDGIPEVQNANRPLLGGGPSAPAVEKNVPKILAYRPEVMVRATVTPISVRCIHESALYFAALGFRNMTFKLAMNCDWSEDDFAVLQSQFTQLAELYIERLVSGHMLNINDFTQYLKSIHSCDPPHKRPCGAGAGMMLIDPRGDIWPCHRFGPHICGGQFRMGTLGGPFNDRLHAAFHAYDSVVDAKAECGTCRAAGGCRTWCYPECIGATRTIYDPGANYCRAVKTVFDCALQISNRLRASHPDKLRDVVERSEA